MNRFLSTLLLTLLLGQTARAQTDADVKRLQADANVYIQVKNFKDAETSTDKMVGAAEQAYGTSSAQFADVLSAAARNYVKIDKTGSAERVILRYIALRKQLKGEHDPAVAQDEAALGSFYVSIGDLSKAEKAYRDAIEIVDKGSSYVRHDYEPDILMGLAKVLRAEKEFAQATNAEEQAQMIRDKKI